MIDHTELTTEQWFRLCKDVYRKLRNDEQDEAVNLLEDVGFGLDVLEI